MACVNNDSAVPDERTWERAGFASDTGSMGKCKMFWFPNYIYIIRWEGDNQQDEMIVNVELDTKLSGKHTLPHTISVRPL